jgi:hypothetical protein
MGEESMQTHERVRPTGRAVGPPPRRTPYWLIARHAHGRLEVLTTQLAGGEEVLPVFSSEEEAQLFVLTEDGSGWQPRQTAAGEIISILCGFYKGVRQVALDPPLGGGDDESIGLVSVGRESFIDSLLGRGRFWFHSKLSR